MTTKASVLDVAMNAVLALRDVRAKALDLGVAIAEARTCLEHDNIGRTDTKESLNRLEASVNTESEAILNSLVRYGNLVRVFQWKNVLRLEQEIQMLRDRVEDLKQANEEANMEELP